MRGEFVKSDSPTGMLVLNAETEYEKILLRNFMAFPEYTKGDYKIVIGGGTYHDSVITSFNIANQKVKPTDKEIKIKVLCQVGGIVLTKEVIFIKQHVDYIEIKDGQAVYLISKDNVCSEYWETCGIK